MIQRIQTVYLFAIIVLALITCTGQIIDFQSNYPSNKAGVVAADSTATGGQAVAYTLNAIYFNQYTNGTLQSSEIQFGLILLVSAIIGWTLNIILGYKNRKRQMLHAKINFVIIAMYLAAVLAKAFTQIPNFTFANMTLKASVGLALIIFMLYLNLRALLLMRKDDELVKSADRLR
jgi:hypothetical protein